MKNTDTDDSGLSKLLQVFEELQPKERLEILSFAESLLSKQKSGRNDESVENVSNIDIRPSV